MPDSTSGIQFDCTYDVTPKYLDIRVTLTNRGPGELGVFNRIKYTLPDGTASFSPDGAYVELDEGTLSVRKMALPIPPGLNMAAYVPPLASRLGAGTTQRETIRLPVPVRVMQPFRRALLDGQVTAAKPAEAQRLTVCYGIFSIDDGLSLLAQDPAHPGAFTVVPPGPAVEGQQLLSTSFQLKEPLAVLDYLAVPWA